MTSPNHAASGNGVLAWVLLALCLYGCAYGIARWRKFVVMTEYYVKEDRLVIRRTGPGFDIRENSRGHLKNELNGPVFLLFRPLEFLEDRVRGGRGIWYAQDNPEKEPKQPVPSFHTGSGQKLVI